MAKSPKSLVFRVANGSSSTRQHAAIHVSFTGRGRPRCWARACSWPHVIATASSYSKTAACCRHSASSARRRGPQLRSVAHLVSSPSVTKLMHKVWPASLARSRSGTRLRKLADATSVSRTTRLTAKQRGAMRTDQPGTRLAPHRTPIHRERQAPRRSGWAALLGGGLARPPARAAPAAREVLAQRRWSRLKDTGRDCQGQACRCQRRDSTAASFGPSR